jgi:hypothetical protein
LRFVPELAALETAGRITSYFTVTREEKPEWQGRRGRISEALLREALPVDHGDMPGVRSAGARQRHAITAHETRCEQRTNPD